MFRAHVLIIRRSKLHHTASDIITPIGGRVVHGTCHTGLLTACEQAVSKPV